MGRTLLHARFQDLEALEPATCLARYTSTLRVPSGQGEAKVVVPAAISQCHFKITSESSKRRVHSCTLFVRVTWRKMKGGELSNTWGILYQGIQKENLLAIRLSAVRSPGGQESPGTRSPLGASSRLKTPVAGRQVGPSDSNWSLATKNIPPMHAYGMHVRASTCPVVDIP